MKLKNLLLIPVFISVAIGSIMVFWGVFPFDVDNKISDHDQMIVGLIRLAIGIPLIVIAVFGLRKIRKNSEQKIP